MKVGALTESELKDKKLRIEDALNATKAAVAEGIVLGGGVALASVYKTIKARPIHENADFQKGYDSVLGALYEPLRQIAENAGYEPDEIEAKQKEAKEGIGFDAKNGVWVNMDEKGIIDPTKVTRSAVLNASSIASLFVTTEAAVTEIKEEKPVAPAMPEGMY